VAGSCECGDEPVGSSATELVSDDLKNKGKSYEHMTSIYKAVRSMHSACHFPPLFPQISSITLTRDMAGLNPVSSELHSLGHIFLCY
jgi:hypothetical protein